MLIRRRISLTLSRLVSGWTLIGVGVGGADREDREGTSCATGGARLDPSPVHHLGRKVTAALFRSLFRGRFLAPFSARFVGGKRIDGKPVRKRSEPAGYSKIPCGIGMA
jgi:hypothetical protein